MKSETNEKSLCDHWRYEATNTHKQRSTKEAQEGGQTQTYQIERPLITNR